MLNALQRPGRGDQYLLASEDRHDETEPAILGYMTDVDVVA